MLSTRSLGGAAAAAPLFFLWQAAFAASLDVSPVRVDLTAGARSAELRLTNTAAEEVSVQVDVREWSQDFDGVQQLLGTKMLLAVPPLVTIPPGEQQIIRIGRLGDVFVDVEQSFRVLVTELAPAAASTDQPALNMRLQLSIPVFVAPISPAEPNIAIVDSAEFGEGEHLFLRNVGKAHAKIAQIEVRSGGEWIPLPADTVSRVRYLLPDAGAPLAIPQELSAFSAIRIKSEDGKEWEHAVSLPQ